MTEKNFDIPRLVELQVIEKIIYKKAFEISRLKKNEKLYKLKLEFSGINESFKAISDELTALEHERKKTGDAIKLQEEKIKTINDKLFSGTITSAKELLNFQEEIKHLKHSNENLEDKEIKLMIEIDEKRPELDEFTEKQNLLDKEIKIISQELEKSARDIETVITELKAKRLEVLKQIPAAILKSYDELRKRKDGVAVSLMKNNFCQACSVQIPAGDLQKIKDEDKIHKCPMCSRMLIINNDSIEQLLKTYEPY